jgi:hypothetical protein
MSEIIDGEVVGLNANDVAYPLLVSLQGETKKGKTYFAASFPNAFILDFAPSKLKFSGGNMDTAALTRSVGEGFRSLFTPAVKPDGIHYVPKIEGFNFNQQYFFVKSMDMLDAAIEKAKMFKETLEPGSGKVWLVIDDSIRWRNMEVIHWLNTKKKWPIKEQFGQITQMMQSKLATWQNDFNIVIIHKMGPDFNTGELVAQAYPGNIEYVSDCVLQIDTPIKDGKRTQVIKVLSNGHCFVCEPNYIQEIENPDPMTVLSALKIPRVLW